MRERAKGAPISSTDDHKAIIRRFADEVVNDGNVDVIDELVDEDAVFYFPFAPEPVHGRDGLKAFVRSVRAGMTDMHETIDEIVAEGDRLVALVTVKGTDTGTMAPDAAGRKVTLTVVSFVRFKEGRILENRQFIGRFAGGAQSS